jgi:predicted sulfurtransferase
MDLDKVILFYAFTPISDQTALMLWQKNLCETLNIKGRIIISEQGINGTLGGKMSDLKKYVKTTKEYPGFKNIDFKREKAHLPYGDVGIKVWIYRGKIFSDKKKEVKYLC